MKYEDDLRYNRTKVCDFSSRKQAKVLYVVTVYKSTETTQSTKNLNLCRDVHRKVRMYTFVSSVKERRKHNSIELAFTYNRTISKLYIMDLGRI